jgi:hypothetical protein
VFAVFGQNPRTRAISAIAGIVLVPFATTARALPLNPTPPVPETPEKVSREAPSLDCLATTLCAVKDRVRWRTPAWKPEFCAEIAQAVSTSAERHNLSPALLVAVMINESDLNEKAFRSTTKNNSLYAKDGGLMGIRCVTDRHNRCTNGNVRGVAWANVMNPVTNIELGARELAHYKYGNGGVSTVNVRVRDAHGRLRIKQKNIPCRHRNHAYWAHYNHGPRYIDRGPARHYPHRIAVIYYAVARAMGLDTRELASTRLTVKDPGKRRRTADRPVEARYHKLCQAIQDLGPICGPENQTAQLSKSKVARPN